MAIEYRESACSSRTTRAGRSRAGGSSPCWAVSCNLIAPRTRCKNSEERGPVLVDAHCHLNFPELAADQEGVMARMEAAGVTHALCVSVNLRTLPHVLALAERYPNIYASVGVHPDEPPGNETTADELVAFASHPRVVAIGETGLDYFRQSDDTEWQRARF